MLYLFLCFPKDELKIVVDALLSGHKGRGGGVYLSKIIVNM